MGKKSNGMLILVAILALATIYLVNDKAQIVKFETTPGQQTTATTLVTTKAAGCPDTLQTTFNLKAKNILDVGSGSYLSGLVNVYDDSTGKEVGTTTVSATGANVASAAFNCGGSYTLYVLGNTTKPNGFSSMKIPVGVITGQSVYKEIQAKNGTSVRTTIYNSGSTNLTVANSQDSTTAAQTYAAGDSNNFFIDVTTGNGTSQWGPDGVTNYICANFNTAVFSKSNGVTVSGLSAMTENLPSKAYSDGMDKCWVSPPLSSSEGPRRHIINIYSDLGNPASADNVVFRWYDGAWFKRNDGSVNQGIADDSNNDLGVGDVSATFDIE